jgi:hypothetical protein
MKYIIPIALLLLAGCAHNYFGVPNAEWEARTSGLGESDLPASPPSAGEDSPWVASTQGAWAAGYNPAGMVNGENWLSGNLTWGNHAQNVLNNDLMAQTTYDTFAYGSRAGLCLRPSNKNWALGTSLSFPYDFTYNAEGAGSVADSSGAIGQISLGAAMRLTRQLALGLEADGLWGNQTLDAHYGAVNLREDRTYSGFNYGGGFQYRAEAWRYLFLGWGASIKRGDYLDGGALGTFQQPPYYVLGIFGSYGIYRVSAEAGYRSWSLTQVSNDTLEVAYGTFCDELRGGGAVDFLLGKQSKVSVGYQRQSIPLRNDAGFRMFDQRYGVGGSFPAGNKAYMTLGLWFGNRGDYNRDGQTVSNIIFSVAASFL